MTKTFTQQLAMVKADIDTEHYLMMFHGNVTRQQYNQAYAFHYVVELEHLYNINKIDG